MTLVATTTPSTFVPNNQVEREAELMEPNQQATHPMEHRIIQGMFEVVETDIEMSDWLTDPRRINEVASPWARRCFARLDALAQRYEELRIHKSRKAQILADEPIIRAAVAWRQFNCEHVMNSNALRRKCTSLPGIARGAAGKITTVIDEIRDHALAAPKEVEVRENALCEATKALQQLGTSLQIIIKEELVIPHNDHEIDVNTVVLRNAFTRAHQQAENISESGLPNYTKRQAYAVTFMAELCSQINQITKTARRERHNEGEMFEHLLKATRWGHALSAFEGRVPQVNTELFNTIKLLDQVLRELDTVTSGYTLAANSRRETENYKIQLTTYIHQLQNLYKQMS